MTEKWLNRITRVCEWLITAILACLGFLLLSAGMVFAAGLSFALAVFFCPAISPAPAWLRLATVLFLLLKF